MSEYFAEAEDAVEVNQESSAERVVEEETQKKIDLLMAQNKKLQDQIKSKNSEISNLKSNLAAQENLSKTYLNEVEQLTIQLSVKDADLVRNGEVMDLLIDNQQRERRSSISGSLVSGRQEDESDSDDSGSRERENDNRAQSEDGDTLCLDMGRATDACPLFFRFGEEECPGTSFCGRNHNPDILRKKGVCFKDFKKKGSCPRGHLCWFSHDTPPELRVDEDFRAFVRGEAEKAAGRKSNPRSRRSSVGTTVSTPLSQQNVHREMSRKGGSQFVSQNEQELGQRQSYEAIPSAVEMQGVRSATRKSENDTENYTEMEGTENFLGQRQIIQLIQEQVQSSISHFMNQICPQMGWSAMTSCY